MGKRSTTVAASERLNPGSSWHRLCISGVVPSPVGQAQHSPARAYALSVRVDTLRAPRRNAGVLEAPHLQEENVYTWRRRQWVESGGDGARGATTNSSSSSRHSGDATRARSFASASSSSASRARSISIR